MLSRLQSSAQDTAFPPKELVPAEPGEPEFEAAKQFTAQKYQRHFQCEMNESMPKSLSLYEADGLVACIGYRAAQAEDLFLEQ